MVQRLENEFSSTDERWAICTGTTDCRGLTKPHIYFTSPLRREDKANNSPSTADSSRSFFQYFTALANTSIQNYDCFRQALAEMTRSSPTRVQSSFLSDRDPQPQPCNKGFGKNSEKSSNSCPWTSFVAINALSLKAWTAYQRSYINYSTF